MSGVQSLIVAPDEADVRLDRWFRRRFPALGHGRLEKLLRTGQIRLDGKRAKAGTRVGAGQTIRVPPLDGAPADAAPKHPPVPDADLAALREAVLFMDERVIAFDKAAGLAVQGGTGQGRHLDAMLDALRFDAAARPKLVHRLDKDTSGVLLLARDDRAARALAAVFRGTEARKTYWAIVAGVPRRARGRIELPLAKLAGQSGEKVMGDRRAGKPAVTLYATVRTHGKAAAWLALRPLTGRTHQLRVHCAALGHPVLGDGKYGGQAAFPPGLDLAKRLHLHAHEIAVPHPDDGTTLRVAAPLPADLTRSWARLGFDPRAGDEAEAYFEA